MGNFLVNEHVQSQYDFCEICNNKDLKINSINLMPNSFWSQGSICFICKNNHTFHFNVVEIRNINEQRESIHRRFSSYQMRGKSV